MDSRIKIPAKLEGGAETLLIPLWTRAMETKRPDTIIRNPKALEIFESLNYDFSKFSGAWMTQTGIAVQAEMRISEGKQNPYPPQSFIMHMEVAFSHDL